MRPSHVLLCVLAPLLHQSGPWTVHYALWWSPGITW